MVYEILCAQLCIWLIGIETLLIFPQKLQGGLPRPGNKILAAISILGIYIFLAIPSRLPAVFNGIPWNTPLEFIFAALLIPISALLNWRVYGQKYISTAIIMLVILRAGSFIFLPETGLGVRSFQAPDLLNTADWFRTYATIVEPAYSDVMKAPYNNLFEFPIDWMTNQDMLNIPRPMIQIALAGYGRLDPGEKLVFLTQGLVSGDILLTDMNSGASSSAAILNSSTDAPEEIKNNGASLQSFAINGNLFFKTNKNYQISAIILKPDHSRVSAFDIPKLWVSGAVFQIHPALISILGWLVTLENLAFAAILTGCLAAAALGAFRQGQIVLMDVFLGMSAAAFLGFISQNLAA